MFIWLNNLQNYHKILKSFSASPTLSYTITKKPIKIFAAQNSLRVLKLLKVFCNRVLFRVLSDSVFFRFLSDLVFFRCLSDRVLFMVLSDRVFFMVLSDRVLFESSVIDSLKGSLVIYSSFGLSILFSRYCRYFYIKRCYHFFQKDVQT